MGDWAKSLIGEDTPDTRKRMEEQSAYSRQLIGDTIPNYLEGYEVIPEQGSGGFMANFKSSIPSDPETRRRVAAEQMFPNDPERQKRVRVMQNGQIVVETPQALGNPSKLQTIDSGFMSKAGKFAAQLPEMVGATLGTAVGGVPGGVLGGTAGRAGKQLYANIAQDEPQTVGGNVKELTWEAVPNALLGWAGKGAVGFMNRKATQELGRLDIPAAEKTIQNVKNLTGIELDLAQATNNPFLKSLKTWASNFPGEASEVAQSFALAQSGQVDNAIGKILSAVSSESADVAGIRGINAAKAAIEGAEIARDAAAAPLYRKAFAQGGAVDLAPTMQLLDERISLAKGPIRSALERARGIIRQGSKSVKDAAGNPAEQLDTSLLGVHNAQRALQEMIDKASGARVLGPEAKRELIAVRESLLDGLDNASPVYKAARDVYREQSQKLVNPLKESIVGVISELPSKEAARASAMLFQGRLPSIESIRYAKGFIKKAEVDNPELRGSWDGMVRQFLESKYELASKLTSRGKQMNTAGRFREMIAGTPAQRRALNEMLGPDESKLVSDTLGALEMVSRTPIATSLTEFNRIISERFKGKVASIMKFVAQPMQSIVGQLDDKFLQDNAKRIIQGITDPTKRQLLKQLQTVPPGKERAILTVGILLGQQAGNVGEEALRVDKGYNP